MPVISSNVVWSYTYFLQASIKGKEEGEVQVKHAFVCFFLPDSALSVTSSYNSLHGREHRLWHNGISASHDFDQLDYVISGFVNLWPKIVHFPFLLLEHQTLLYFTEKNVTTWTTPNTDYLGWNLSKEQSKQVNIYLCYEWAKNVLYFPEVTGRQCPDI